MQKERSETQIFTLKWWGLMMVIYLRINWTANFALENGWERHTHTILWPKRPRKKAEKLVEFMQLCLLERKQQMIAPSKSCYLNQQERDQGLKGLANLAIWGGIVVSSEPGSLNSWCWGRSSHWKMTGIRIMGTKAAAIGLMTVPLTWRTNGSLDPGTHESGGAAGFHEALFGQLTIHHDSCC